MRWKTIPNYPAYEVSDTGLVRRELRLKKQRIKRGYALVHLYHDGVSIWIGVHRVLLVAFRGAAPEDRPESRHLNGNALDNRLDNLVWGTRQENSDDKLLHGTQVRGEQSGRAKLTAADVSYVLSSTESTAELAEKLGVARGTIQRICRGTSWKHLRRTPTEKARKINRGENNGAAKLTVDQVRAIRISSESVQTLRRKLGVSWRTVWLAKNNHTWKELQ